MFNLVPELASADSQVSGPMAVSQTCSIGGGHHKLRQLDMPRNFFSGNNCVRQNTVISRPTSSSASPLQPVICNSGDRRAVARRAHHGK